MRLACWFCARALDPVDVLADGSLEPREVERGGPLYRYRCPGCRRENICERNARGRILARPRESVPIIDRVQAVGDPALAEEHARRRAWWARHEGVVGWFHGEFVTAIDAGLWDDLGRAAGAGDDPEGPPAGSREAPGEGRPAPQAAPPADPHVVLGVPRSASRDEVVAAFRRLAKQHHPDLFAAQDAAAQAAAHRRFVEILDAYARLRESAG